MAPTEAEHLTVGSNIRLAGYDGMSIHHYGSFTMPCQHGSTDWQNLTFYVTNANGPVLFGYNTQQASPHYDGSAEERDAYPQCD